MTTEYTDKNPTFKNEPNYKGFRNTSIQYSTYFDVSGILVQKTEAYTGQISYELKNRNIEEILSGLIGKKVKITIEEL